MLFCRLQFAFSVVKCVHKKKKAELSWSSAGASDGPQWLSDIL